MSLKTIPSLVYFCLAMPGIQNCSATETSSRQWAAVHSPTHTEASQSIGSYSAGCIAGANILPLDGQGYEVMRTSRKRYYGHPALIQFIQTLGRNAAEQKLGTLLVGDLGQARGGPTPSGHRSHQTGLDVDIWFLLPYIAKGALLSESDRETWAAPSMLDKASNIDFSQWTSAQEKLLEIAAQQPEVERIFVNPAIKRELCQKSSNIGNGWLRKIRPWWKHDDHFHVRLKCPADNPHCQAQLPVPEGDGCGADLAWWFSAAAHTPAKKTVSKPIKLPGLCEKILNEMPQK